MEQNATNRSAYMEAQGEVSLGLNIVRLGVRPKWNTSDFRFVQKDGNIYAFIMKAPKNRTIIIKTLLEELKVNKISLLVYGEVQYQQSYGTLIIKLPDNLPTIYTNCIKIHTS